MDLYDVVALREGIPDENLAPGAVGTIVHVFDHVPAAYEVEFADSDGRTVSMVTLTTDQIRPLGTPS
ncbi:DUF4926 domain-containing protein [Micromonospora craniellae]|uniref:DUF4926 domain-containing protein n=1 Tax=Micromonospora craniellae TaxID=2294034 RepID=A0A372G2F2_9ACTN|nr:DUF4926 domain-containing protein [Micromonospora craniellae]QOC91775.1 DUF4926 domain-containing protein [Micromonospora craniellae]RFS47153.1 DUF4926 domain-containing protein [Micromonospora craniellae]